MDTVMKTKTSNTFAKLLTDEIRKEPFLCDCPQPRFQILCRIGHGAFGEVFKARDLLTNDVVALKRIFRRQPQRGVCSGTANEIAILEKVQHDNVVRLLGAYRTVEYSGIYFEFCPTDLGRALNYCAAKLALNDIATPVLREILKGLDACHTAGIMHRDLKPSNILINHNGKVKIADFGQGRFCLSEETSKIKYTPTVTSRWYRAPELLFSSQSYDTSVDIWAVGMIYAQLLGGKPLLNGESDLEQISLLIQCFGSINLDLWPEARDLPDFSKLIFESCKAIPMRQLLPNASKLSVSFLESVLKYNPRHRPTAKQCLMHPLLKDMHDTWAFPNFALPYDFLNF